MLCFVNKHLKKLSELITKRLNLFCNCYQQKITKRTFKDKED